MARAPRPPNLSLWDKIALWLDLPPGGLSWRRALSTLIPVTLVCGLFIGLLLRSIRDPERLTGYQRARVLAIATQLGTEHGPRFSITAELADGTKVRLLYAKPILLFAEGDEICLATFERIRSGQDRFAITTAASCETLPELPKQPFP
ncbi:hypothetical protein [Celeribacter neptunius]|uniref:Uncharacterized protein n=1 Tax=Celeribacter neptunius TaxID=588602 RepID=A0A1I3K3T5_9RHOB|nr:hypothetical protein [Celeribacter neptunius]SFI66978.1 hypothetical protein SAMN04487991_0559 [Celeribacter neptunius]